MGGCVSIRGVHGVTAAVLGIWLLLTEGCSHVCVCIKDNDSHMSHYQK